MSDANSKAVEESYRLSTLPNQFTAHFLVQVEHMSPAALEAHKLGAESAVRVAEAQERAAVATAEANVSVAKAQENAQVTPAKLLTLRHIVSALVVSASLVLIFKKPAIGWYVVGVDAILGAIQFTDQIFKKFFK